MISILTLIVLVILSFYIIWRIYRNLKQGRPKSIIIMEVILLLGCFALFIILQIKSGKKPTTHEGSAEAKKETKLTPTESVRVTKLLSELKDYLGELNQTAKPEVQSLLKQGLEYKVGSEHLQAAQVFKQALDLNLTGGEKSDFLILMGNSEAFIKEYDSAINHYYQAVRLGQNAHNDTVLAVAYSNLAVVYQLKEDLKGVLESYFDLLSIDRKVGNSFGEKNTLARIGFIYQMQGNADSARVYHEKSLKKGETTQDPLNQAAQMNNLALVYRSKGNLDSAIVLYSRSLMLFQQAGDQKDAASVITNIGLIYQETGNSEEALNYHYQALAIDSSLGDIMGQGGDLTNIGSVMEQKGEFNRALEFYQRAVVLFEKANAKREAGFVRENIRRVEKKIKG